MKAGSTLLLFTLTAMDSMLAKGNVWYVRHYESHFDRVYVAYLLGGPLRARRRGKTVLVSLGIGSRIGSLLLAPVRLLALARRIRPDAYLTADIFFSWWTTLLARIFLRAPIVLMPVSIPPELYAQSRRGVIGLPQSVEQVLTRMCFRSARRVIMSRNGETTLKWLRSEPAAARKLKVVPMTVEELPPRVIYDGLENYRREHDKVGSPPLLLYVGRLHPEKLPWGLVDMMAHLRDLKVDARLVIAGDGVTRQEMEARADELGVRHLIDFRGFVESGQLVDWYRRADIFISTVTGTSLREAGLYCLPIVAYRVDWVKDLMQHGDTALLVEPGDSQGLARQVAAVLQDGALRRRIAEAFNHRARQLWHTGGVGNALHESFAGL